MSYQSERDQFIARMTREGLSLDMTRALLRAATTIQRYAELACSDEATDRDRVPCPAVGNKGPCLCDRPNDGHDTVTRITVREWNLTKRLECTIPKGWAMQTDGDPRGYTLRVIPPSYAERNQGRDRFNLETIGVPSGDTRVRF